MTTSARRSKTLIAAIFLVCLACALTLARTSAEVRKWTNQSGTVINAELGGYDGETATLIVKGKSFAVPVDKLSKEDQEWLENWQKEQAAKLDSLVGSHDKVPITQRYGASTDDYFAGPFGKQLRKFYDTKLSICDDGGKGLFMKCDESVAWKDETMHVYCPKSYRGDATPMGVYIHISPGDNPIKLQAGYAGAMDSRRLIYASPSGTGNARSDTRRMALVLDTLATLRNKYKIDEDRIFVGGVSGGGAMSAWLTVYFPEFRAAICQVRNAFIPHEKCFPTIEEKDVRGIARRKQAFAWVTGPKDFNYKHILNSGPSWETKKFVSKVFDIPGMGHHSAPAKALEDALTWAENASTPPAK